MASCFIIRNKKTNEIEEVLAPNQGRSILFSSLMETPEYRGNKEAAIRTWAKAYTNHFKEGFGDWELLSKASSFSSDIYPFMRSIFIEDPERFLFEMAQQLNSSESEATGARETLGKNLTEIAIQMFPDARPGDDYISKFDGKLDNNYEPLSEYLEKESKISFNRESPNYKEVLSPENQKEFKNLIAQGLVTSRRWNGMYFVPKQRHEIVVSTSYRDYRDGYWVPDQAKYRQLRGVIDSKQLGWLEVEESKTGGAYIVKIVPDRQTARQEKLFKEVGNSAFTNIADRLSKRLQVPYQVIDTATAIKLTQDSNIPWNGEGGFAYKGKVYILQDALSIDNAIHEFSHFFIEAVSKESPGLIEKLYKEFQVDPEAKSKYVDFVEEMYSEFSPEDRMKEAMVRAITDKALGLVDEKTGNVILDAIRRIFNTIKSLIRNLFGVTVRNLDENTTLDQLAAILIGEKDGEVVDLGDKNTSFFQGLFPMFNREMADELGKLPSVAVKSGIDSFFTVASEHLNRLREDRDLNKLREIFSNDKESTLLKDEKEILKLAQQFAVTLEPETSVDRAALTSFAEGIEGQEVISQKMADHVATFDQAKDMSNQEKLAIFRKYSFIAKEWDYVLNKFNEAIENSPVGRGKNPLSESVQNIRKNYEYINNQIKTFYKKDGLVTVFREEIQENPYYQASIAEQKARIEELQKAYDANKSLALGKKLEKEKDLLRRYELTDETIAKYLAGEMGDTNYYSMYLESYTSNPDPIVGTFTNWFLKHKFRAQVRAQERLTKFENNISKIYKKLGFTPKDFQKVAENLVQRETTFDKIEKDGKTSSYGVYKFINQYGDDNTGLGWDLEYNRLREEKESSRARMYFPLRSPGYEKMSGEEEYREKSRLFEQFKLDYMFDEEGDKVREARLFWFRDDLTHEAKMKQEEIFNKIRKNSFTDISKDESLEKADENRAQWREYRQLSSLTDKYGQPKTGRDLEIAKTIQEYRQKYGNLYEQVEIKGMFEANALSFRSQTVDALIAAGTYQTEAEAVKSPEFREKINNWYRDNIRVTLNESFYDKRKAITDRISAITSKIDNEAAKRQLDIGEKWKNILEILKGYRDDDNQPIGTDLVDSQIKAVKDLQEDIDGIKETYNRLNGISDEEAEEYFGYFNTLQIGLRLSDEQYQRYKELDAKTKLKLSPEDRAELNRAFDDLKALQSKISTPYYVDKVNDWLATSGSKMRITQLDSENILNPRIIHPILNQNPDFQKWWSQNHLLKEKWDASVQNVTQSYERLYIWNRIIPNEDLFKTLLEKGDFEGLVNYKSPNIEVKKSQEYYYRRLKPEFVNKRSKDTEWVTHDNRGNWMPKPTLDSATPEQKKYMDDHGIPYAKDDRFENKKYLDLRDNKKDLFNLLDTYKKFHLETQDSLARYARLGLEIPRLRKNRVETADLSKLAEKPQEWWNNLKGWVGAMFSKRRDDYELGTGNYNAASQAQTYALTDLMGNQINSVPIKYMSYIDPDLVSMDVGKAVSMYAVSAETNKLLQEINPIANALKETLSEGENKPKDLTTKRRNIIQIIGNAFDATTNRSANKKGSYNRLKIISNFLDRELEGQTTIQQFGTTGEKIVNTIMKMGAWGSLGLNVFAAVKNDLAGRLQNNLEAVVGKNITPSTLIKSNVEFGKLMTDLITDYYKIGDKSFYTQLFLLFDPLNYYQQKAGTNFSKTGLRDALDMKFVMSLQKFGEINIQGSAWLAMMLHQKVDYTDPETKQTKKIPYLEAWTMKDGIISTKDGIDEKWGKEGSNFLQFTTKVHKVNELNQGAYSEESQPEIHRMTLGKLFLFMRKFYVPGAVNRFSKKRYNSSLGDFREGYWIPLMDVIGTTVKSASKGKLLTASEYKTLYSPSERLAMLRALSEIGFVGMCALLIMALGFNGDDEDKYAELKENSWIHNFLIYQTMLVKSEAETFIPFYGMGVNETVRFLGTPSIAFNTARRWVKVGQDFLAWVTGDKRAYYQQTSGIYEEGQIKFMADLLNIIGWKNFAYLTSNEDLQQGLKIYASLQRRI